MRISLPGYDEFVIWCSAVFSSSNHVMRIPWWAMKREHLSLSTFTCERKLVPASHPCSTCRAILLVIGLIFCFFLQVIAVFYILYMRQSAE